MIRNLMLSTDSYKHSHFLQYPPGTQFITSYIEARVGDDTDIVQFFGLRAFLFEYLSKPITKTDIEIAEQIVTAHGLPFNRAGWEIILYEHDGYLPLRIEAIPEGLALQRGTPLVQVTNTDARLPWLVGFIETTLLRAIWYGSSVATSGLILATILSDALLHTTGSSEGVEFKLHDFGARGVSSGESAALGGLAHLVNFKGTDTVEALRAAQVYYGHEETVAGYSIPASEHSTMTAWGRDREVDAYLNMLDQFPTGLVSVVLDSYDYFAALELLAAEPLRSKILGRAGKLIVRPDSGDPAQVSVDTLNRLGHLFGFSVNACGFKELDPHLGMIFGDGMNTSKIAEVLDAITDAGWAVSNIAFGMGGGLLQGHMRDDLRFAMKANQIVIDGVAHDIQKKPATDPSKASRAGRQAVIHTDESGLVIKRHADCTPAELENNLLTEVWVDGVIKNPLNLDKVREIAAGCREVLRETIFGEAESAQQAAE